MNEKGLYELTRGYVLWFTGPPAAGKSTLSLSFREYFQNFDLPVVLLDGDELRRVFSALSGDSVDARVTRAAAYADLTAVLAESRLIVLLAAINHTERQRDYARARHPADRFAIAWVDTPIEVCIERDPKGLYRNAKARLAVGEEAQMVGLDIPFEAPSNAELVFPTTKESIADSCSRTTEFLIAEGVIAPLSIDARKAAPVKTSGVR